LHAATSLSTYIHGTAHRRARAQPPSPTPHPPTPCRFESLTGQNLLQLLGVAIITGLLWWQRGQQLTLAAGSDVIGLLFFELLFPSFKALFAALFTFPNEFRWGRGLGSGSW
jgi:hypothetical protein